MFWFLRVMIDVLLPKYRKTSVIRAEYIKSTILGTIQYSTEKKKKHISDAGRIYPEY